MRGALSPIGEGHLLVTTPGPARPSQESFLEEVVQWGRGTQSHWDWTQLAV